MTTFIENKYTRWYYAIVANAQARTTTGYIEKHHIIPRSLGGNDAKSNIVSLTAREHFVCHLLLTKMVTGIELERMIHAVWYMSNIPASAAYKINSLTYERLRKQRSTVMSNRMAGSGNVMYGKKHSEETKQKIREKRAQQDMSHLTNREFTPEWRAKIKAARAKQDMSHMRGRVVGEETRNKMKANIARRREAGTLDNNRKRAIICVNNGVIYESVTVATKELNISPASIHAVLNGKKSQTKGFKFKYA